MLYMATSSGIACAEQKGDWRVIGSGLSGDTVTSVIARSRLVLAGTKKGIFSSEDGGNNWREAEAGPTVQHIRWMEWGDNQSGSVLTGTEPAMVFRSNDRGKTWLACPEVAELRDRFGWSLPYSPEAGCVRGFARHGSHAYAEVEVGGVLVSNDDGRTWQLVPGSDGHPGFRRPPAPRIHPNVHSILVHPSSSNMVYAPTGGRFYRSGDGGVTWHFIYDCYCRAAWVDPTEPDHIVLGPANGVNTGGRIEETHDGGKTWSPASVGLSVPWAKNMVERFLQVGDELLAVLSDGSLLSTPIPDFSWRFILPEVTRINAVEASEW